MQSLLSSSRSNKITRHSPRWWNLPHVWTKSAFFGPSSFSIHSPYIQNPVYPFPPHPHNALSQILSDLLNLANTQLPPPFSPISHATLTTPIFLTYTQWKTHIASLAASLNITLLGALGPYTNALEAAAAGDGYMMCTNYTTPPACLEEINSLPFDHIMAIEYTPSALSALSSFSLDEPDAQNSFVDTNLGAAAAAAAAAGAGRNRRDADYWLHLRIRLLHLLQQSSSNLDSTPIQRLILTGSSAHDPVFLRNIRDAFVAQSLAQPLPSLHPLSPFASTGSSPFLPSLLHGTAGASDAGVPDPTFAASLGAAELCKRAMEAPEACVEERRCVQRRRELSKYPD